MQSNHGGDVSVRSSIGRGQSMAIVSLMADLHPAHWCGRLLFGRLEWTPASRSVPERDVIGAKWARLQTIGGTRELAPELRVTETQRPAASVTLRVLGNATKHTR